MFSPICQIYLNDLKSLLLKRWLFLRGCWFAISSHWWTYWVDPPRPPCQLPGGIRSLLDADMPYNDSVRSFISLAVLNRRMEVLSWVCMFQHFFDSAVGLCFFLVGMALDVSQNFAKRMLTLICRVAVIRFLLVYFMLQQVCTSVISISWLIFF